MSFYGQIFLIELVFGPPSRDNGIGFGFHIYVIVLLALSDFMFACWIANRIGEGISLTRDLPNVLYVWLLVNLLMMCSGIMYMKILVSLLRTR